MEECGKKREGIRKCIVNILKNKNSKSTFLQRSRRGRSHRFCSVFDGEFSVRNKKGTLLVLMKNPPSTTAQKRVQATFMSGNTIKAGQVSDAQVKMLCEKEKKKQPHICEDFNESLLPHTSTQQENPGYASHQR